MFDLTAITVRLNESEAEHANERQDFCCSGSLLPPDWIYSLLIVHPERFKHLICRMPVSSLIQHSYDSSHRDHRDNLATNYSWRDIAAKLSRKEEFVNKFIL